MEEDREKLRQRKEREEAEGGMKEGRRARLLDPLMEGDRRERSRRIMKGRGRGRGGR